MSLFNLPVEIKEKPVSEHPWGKSIKDEYSHKIKRAHNSVNNVVYPTPKTKRRDRNPIKFTVIGNRVTREFIYCVNLVQGMHKYRWRKFDAPVIRGVTEVEWPHVLHGLQRQFGGLAFCIRNQVAVLCNDSFLGGDQELKDLIETRYLYHLALNYQQESTKQFINFVKASGRTCAYLHISIDNKPVGTLMFMLYTDVVPNTCENFLRLCKQTRGGYSGTPVHRVVKDGWIQCGGYGLKRTHLPCENFIIPHDKRGVLGMANAGRHMDCSTQFYVLLQPAEWMNTWFVAFGQLIDGDQTLQLIEKVNTYYESPTEQIIIHRAGILNLDCQDIAINKNTNAYIQKHIEDLVQIADIFYELLMERVFLEIEFRRIAKFDERGGENIGEGEAIDVDGQKNLHPTQRFVHKKADVPVDKSQHERRLSSRSKGSRSSKRISSQSHSKDRKAKEDADNKEDNESNADNDNNEFDVEDYNYEPEEYQYPQASAAVPPTPKPEQPYYLAMTDVPYPGEKDSTFDLKRFLQGDYCLESDLDPKYPKRLKDIEVEKSLKTKAMSEVIASFKESDDEDDESEEDLDSDDEREIKDYLKDNAEHASFSGHLIRTMAKCYIKDNPIEDKASSERFTDEEVRRLKLVKANLKSREAKKVAVGVVPWHTEHHIQRRPTGFIRPFDLAKIIQMQDAEDDDEDEDEEDANEKLEKQSVHSHDDRKVMIAAPSDSTSRAIKRRQTGFIRPEDVAQILKYRESAPDHDDDDDDSTDDDDRLDADDEDSNIKIPGGGKVRITSADPTMHPVLKLKGRGRESVNEYDEDFKKTRPSVLVRLYDDVAFDDNDTVPTLKDYKPISEIKLKKMMLTTSDNQDLAGYDFLFKRDDHFKPSTDSLEQILDLQHGKKLTRKISTDYVNTIDKIERRQPPSLRVVEFARTRPSLSVSQYQMKNQLHAMEEARKKQKEEEAQKHPHQPPHQHHNKTAGEPPTKS